MAKKDKLLDIRNLSTNFFTQTGVVSAVDNLSFDLKKGEIVGLAGESGCGKSTAAYSIIRMVPYPGKIVGGEILFQGEDLVKKSKEEMRKIRWKDISIIFQGAMNALNPVFEVGEQIVEAIQIHEDASSEEAWNRVSELYELVGLDPDRMHNYPHEYSGGMRQRAMIAMALANNPKIVIADEPTTALDVTIQAQILKLIEKLAKKFDLSMIFISHDLGVIAETSHRIAIMYAGRMAEFGSGVDVFEKPLHPYTAGLVGSVPSMDKAGKRILTSIPGMLPDLIRPPSGCRFHPRCPFAKQKCKDEIPEYRELDNRLVACHFSEEIQPTLLESLEKGWEEYK
ncbi:MAG: ABC transporter ATP-binding protein [Candidatus Ranarchaeia archaeon]